MSQVKDAAIKIIENLPDQATLDDIMYQLYVKKKIDLSLKAAEDGKVGTPKTLDDSPNSSFALW